MASSPDILDELPWLKVAQRNARKAQWLRHARSALLLGALAAPLLFANGHFGWTSGVPGSSPAPTGPATPAVIDSPFAPKALRPLSALEAETWNSKIPQTAAVAAATPFAVGTADAQSLSRSLQCMTAAIYYEAGNEPVDGQRAVAQVILNRMRSPIFPHSVCGVVYQGSERKTGCQFTFTCDGSLARVPAAASWARASMVATAALGGYVYAPVGWATNYHADYVVPYWAQSLQKLTTIGRHIFYGWKGNSGTGTAFTSRYAGVEPDVTSGLALATQQASTALVDPTRGIVPVTSAERPLISFAPPEAAAPGAAPAKSKAPEALHPTVDLGSRWIIGGTGQAGGLRRLPPRTAILPTGDGQPSAKGGMAEADTVSSAKTAAPASE
jgi:spore germination cell wall hydrolase CwlJ-like protein